MFFSIYIVLKYLITDIIFLITTSKVILSVKTTLYPQGAEAGSYKSRASMSQKVASTKT